MLICRLVLAGAASVEMGMCLATPSPWGSSTLNMHLNKIKCILKISAPFPILQPERAHAFHVSNASISARLVIFELGHFGKC